MVWDGMGSDQIGALIALFAAESFSLSISHELLALSGPPQVSGRSLSLSLSVQAVDPLDPSKHHSIISLMISGAIINSLINANHPPHAERNTRNPEEVGV